MGKYDIYIICEILNYLKIIHKLVLLNIVITKYNGIKDDVLFDIQIF